MLFFLKTKIKFFIIFCLFLLISSDVFALGCGGDANPALRTMCEIIYMIQGRIGRALVFISVMTTAWQFANGGIKWDGIAKLVVAIGLVFAPKTFALFLLPDYIEGIEGLGYVSTDKISPDEIISCVCPDLM